MEEKICKNCNHNNPHSTTKFHDGGLCLEGKAFGVDKRDTCVKWEPKVNE